jgi:hypothetical protein
MATKYYLDQPGLERLVDYINNSLNNKANVGDVPANVVVQSDLADYALKSDIPESADLSIYATKVELEDYATAADLTELEGKVTGVYHFRGSVADLAALQAIQDPEEGDVYNITDTGMNAAWTGSVWDEFGSVCDLSDYLLIEDVQAMSIPTVDSILYGGKSAVVSDVAGLNAMLANDEPEVTVVLSDNITSSISIPAGKKVILDLGGNSARTITASGEGSEVVVKNGTVASGSSANAITVASGGKATIEDGATIIGTRNNGIEVKGGGEVVVNGGEISAQEAGIYPSGGGTITINGGTISCVDNGGLMANGTAGRGGNTIVMNGGRIEGHIVSGGYLACGVYLPNDDVFTMNGGEIISDGVGIVLRGGKAILNGGVVEGNGTTAVKGKVGDSRVVVGPYAVVYDMESAYPAKDSLELVVGAEMILRGTDGDIDIVGDPANANITDNR